MKVLRCAAYPLIGLAWLASRPKVLRRAAAPLLLNVVLFAGIGWVYFERVRALMGLIPLAEGGVGTAVMTVAWLFVTLLFGALVFFSFGLAANALSAPFHEGLSARVEAALAEEGAAIDVFEGGPGAAAAVAGEVVKFLILAAVGIPAGLAAMVVPALGPVLYVFLAWYAGLEFVDITWARRAPGVRERIRFLMRHPAALFGFGLTATLLLTIPVLNLAALPACVIGGTLLYHRELRASR